MMEILTTMAENWEVIAAGAVVMMASAEKLILIAIFSAKNVKDAWKKAFPKKDRYTE